MNARYLEITPKQVKREIDLSERAIASMWPKRYDNPIVRGQLRVHVGIVRRFRAYQLAQGWK